jgi:HSP20 family protein
MKLNLKKYNIMNTSNCNPKNGHRLYNGFLKTPVSFDKLFGDLMTGSGVEFSYGKFPSVNVSEDEQKFTLELIVPGFEKEEIKISLDDNKLNVTGEKKQAEDAEVKNYTRREFKAEKFDRAFTMPENINAEAIKAEFKSGILFIELPKQSAEKKESKSIVIS